MLILFFKFPQKKKILYVEHVNMLYVLHVAEVDISYYNIIQMFK